MTRTFITILMLMAFMAQTVSAKAVHCNMAFNQSDFSNIDHSGMDHSMHNMNMDQTSDPNISMDCCETLFDCSQGSCSIVLLALINGFSIINKTANRSINYQSLSLSSLQYSLYKPPTLA